MSIWEGCISRARLVVALSAAASSSLACSDRPSATPPERGSTAPARVEDDAQEESAGRLAEIRVTPDEIAIADEVVATPRPASAPGVMDDELRATYRIAALAAALSDAAAPSRDAPRRVRVEAEVPVGVLRGVLATVTEPGAPVRLQLEGQEGEGLLLTRAATDDPRPLLHLRRDGVQLERDGALTPVSPSLEALIESDEELKLDALALAIPDDRSVQELAALADAIRGDDDGATVTLAYSFDPCLEPPEGMVCIPGGPAIVGYDDGLPEERPRRGIVLSTFYIKLDRLR